MKLDDWVSIGSDKKPENYRIILIAYEYRENIGMAVGYYKNKGSYGYFVAPATPIGSKFICWNDCLGNEFIPFRWKMKQVINT